MKKVYIITCTMAASKFMNLLSKISEEMVI